MSYIMSFLEIINYGKQDKLLTSSEPVSNSRVLINLFTRRHSKISPKLMRRINKERMKVYKTQK